MPLLPTTYNSATLRKIEGGSTPVPPVRMWQELGNLYARLAEERHVPIDAQPSVRPEAQVTDTVNDVAAAIREQTKAMVASQAQIAEAILAQTELLREALQSGIVPGLLDWAEIQRQRLEAEATPPPRPKSGNRPEPARRP